MVDGMAAARTLLGFRNITPGMCLNYVWLAYRAQGARVDGSWPTAYAAWVDTPGKHEGDRNPPPGVPVYWGRRRGDGGTPNDRAGDITISIGDGRVAATDYPGWGTVGTCTIDEREKQIGRPYLGWTETILGVPIDVVSAAPAATNAHAFTTTSTPRPPMEEDDMRTITWNGHLLTFGPQQVLYHDTYKLALDAAFIHNPDHAPLGLDDEGMTAICQTSGVPWSAVDACMQRRAYDLAGGVGGPFWSRHIEQKIDTAQLAKSIEDLRRTAASIPAPTSAPVA